MEELNDFTEEKEESTFDLKAEIFKYIAYWKWILLGFLIGGLIAYLYNRYTIPKYSTEATMMIVDDQEKNAMNATPSGGGAIFSLEDDGIQNHIEKLKSKQLVESVVDELNHNVSYFIEGNVITVEAYKSSPVLIEFITPDSIIHSISKNLIVTPTSDTSFKLEEEASGYSKDHSIGEVIKLDNIQFTILPKSGGEEGTFRKTSPVNIRIQSLRAVAAEYISKLQISQKGQAKDILALSLVHASSGKSEDFLNKLMERFNEEGIEDKQEVAENTTQFIQDRLEMITTELDSVEGGIAEFKRENRLMDISSGASEFQSKFSAAEQEIFGLETELSLLESIEEVLRNQGNYELLPEVGISEGGVAGLITSYNTLVMERNMYLKAGTEKNPIVETITEQLDSLRENLYENIESTRRSLNVRLRELNQRENVAQGQFSNFPGLEKGMRSIQRQQEIKEQLYLFLLQRREEAAISFAATASVARVIDAAFTNNAPVDPKPWLILVGGFIIGLIIPILIIFLKDMLDTRVHHKGELSGLIKHIPFIGEVPRITSDQSEQIELNDRSPLAESFRILRTNLAYLIQNKDKDRGEVIFITSTIKGEGKTFVSYNMARTLGSTGKKVLLIGADIRNPKLHRYADVAMGEKGVSDYLYDFEVTEDQIISKDQSGSIKIDMVLSGPIPPNPAELLMNDRMEQLIKYASKVYDYVLVDTAPTMIVTDTLLISPLADTTLYVVRADLTDKKMLDFPKELKQQGKIKSPAIILNDVDYSKFSYGAKYGYSYGYGYGYGVDKESRWQRIKNRMSGNK
ncbi:GumC family protein [Salegentibacter salegens]|uniref:non-specific protein-tyrosine kinase n=1 Tax=Salegentibacter salegens TaxID=143223 RepID=A0A1M7HEL4_9FLAO|nr:tyrosine-protein kinase family protein [Salegentibacter salegens]PRX44102.1 capsular exopolysaccharide synthesis family protein [Salegentibacter salegens]SHM26884.1 capsular exopolysaccharide family [Salegentibacter salegens]